MFGNCRSCICQQVSGFSLVNENIKSLLNKDNFLVTSVQEDSSMETLTPNMFSSSFHCTTSTAAIVDVLAIGFS